MRVEVDLGKCEGHGLCELTAPQVFQVDDDGHLHVLVTEVSGPLADKASAGARVCPVAALRMVA